MVDLNKLSQFNVNDIDLEKIIRVVQEHQNTAIKALLVIGALFILVNLFNDHRLKEQELRAQMSQAQQKLAAIKTRDDSAVQLSGFQNTLPKRLNQFQLISLLSSYASSNHIAIPSLSPSLNRDMGMYDEIIVNFNGVADNFRDVVLFIRTIEKSDFPLRVDSWTGQEAENGAINFSVILTAVDFHK